MGWKLLRTKMKSYIRNTYEAIVAILETKNNDISRVEIEFPANKLQQEDHCGPLSRDLNFFTNIFKVVRGML